MDDPELAQSDCEVNYFGSRQLHNYMFDLLDKVQCPLLRTATNHTVAVVHPARRPTCDDNCGRLSVIQSMNYSQSRDPLVVEDVHARSRSDTGPGMKLFW